MCAERESVALDYCWWEIYWRGGSSSLCLIFMVIECAPAHRRVNLLEKWLMGLEVVVAVRCVDFCDEWTLSFV